MMIVILSAKYVENEHYLLALLSRALTYIVALRRTFKMAREGRTIFTQTTTTSCSGAAGIMPARIWVVGFVSHVYLRNMALFLKGPPEEL